MKKFVFLGLVLFYFKSIAQHSDCITALPFCSGPAQTTATVKPGDGNVPNETILSCVDNEYYSTWYTFTVSSNGYFRFVLTPVNPNDDYDWALFNTTGYTCEDIPLFSSLLVSCNSYGSFGVNGPTGISTALGGVGNQNGPGSTNGPPFNADLYVNAGETYKLMVSNWSQSTQGFKIDVSSSTAEDVYTNIGITNFNNQEVCLGNTPDQIDVDFVGTAFGLLKYDWQPANIFVDPSVQDPVFNSNLTQTTEVTLNLTNGPCTFEQTRTIYVGNVEYNKENQNQNICKGENTVLGIEFTGVELPSGLKYTWSPSNLINNPNLSNPTSIPLTDTTQFYFTIQNGPCPIVYDSLLVMIHHDTVNANFYYQINDNEDTRAIEIDFINLSFGNIKNEWRFGDSSAISTVENPIQHPFPGYDSYEVMLAVQSASSFCVDTIRKILEFPEIIFPNIITPNNDNLNDILKIKGLKFGIGLKIYNRWGKKIFETEDYLHNWNAENIPDGMYFYEFFDKNNQITKGWMQILR